MQLLPLLHDFSHLCACVIYVKLSTKRFPLHYQNQDNHQTSGHYLTGLLHWAWNSAHSSVTALAEGETGHMCHQNSGLQDVSLLTKLKQWRLKSVRSRVLSFFQDLPFCRKRQNQGEVEGASVLLAHLLTTALASLSLSPKKVIETEHNGHLPAGLGMALHIVLSTTLKKWLHFLLWCLLSFLFCRERQKSQRGKKNGWTWKVTNTRFIVQFQQLSIIIALFSKVAPSQVGTWSTFLWLMLTIFDSNKSITLFISLSAFTPGLYQDTELSDLSLPPCRDHP